jgi:MFS family permease
MTRSTFPLLRYTSDPTVQANARNSLIDGMLFCVMVGFTNPFFGILAIKLGASDFEIGLLTSLPALLSLLAMIPGAIITGRYRSPLMCVIHYAALHRVWFLVLAALPWIKFPGVSPALVFIIILSLMNFPGSVAGVAWTTLMGDLFPADIRGQVFGERNMLTALVSLLCTLAAGVALARVVYPWNYSLLYVLSFAATMGSLYYLTKLREPRVASASPDPGAPVPAVPAAPAAPAVTDPARQEGRTVAQAAGAFGRVLRARPFMLFTAGSFLMHIGLNLPASLWTILFVRVLNLSESWLATFATISGAFAMLAYPFWGRLADRHGNRWVFIVCCLAFIPMPFLYTFVRSPYPIILLQIASGVAGSGFGLSIFNLVLEVSPSARRADYVAVFNTAMGLTGFLMPMIGVSFYASAGMPAVFAVSSLIRVAAVGALMWVSGGRAAAAVISRAEPAGESPARER